ncbi:ABC transporter permease [Neobacillus niacini]|uniref:ABC transporter permease n=1 Tax=Neobacillus niacini TaxID=86668 RepID=UPI00203F6CB3|nr:ABC transporter permease [Neobacillus niacini]MCM3693908.1 ABC transporter permease [Neobacillus niacini]
MKTVAQTNETATLRNKSKFSFNKMDGNILRLLIIMFTIFIVASITKPDTFLSLANFLSMEKQLVEYGLMAIGVGIAMIAGGIDLSAVYIANLSAIVAGLFMKTFASAVTGTEQILFIVLGILLGLLTGVVCGLFNGFLIAKLRVPAMLATLGTMQLYMGIAIIMTGGSIVSGLPQPFAQLGRTNVFQVFTLSFIVYLVIVAFFSYYIGKTKYGMKLYLLGTNEKATKFAGIKNHKIIMRAYMLSGVISASAGLLSLARINSAKADFGSSFVMLTILIAVLGGINPDGGKGKIYGIFLATIIVQLMSSYLNMFPQISNFYRDMIWGIALILVLIINYVLNKKSEAKLMRLTSQ